MQSVETLDPAELQRGERAILVGTTKYDHYKHGTIETEVVVVIHGSFESHHPGWTGGVNVEVSIAGGTSHSGRHQARFEAIRTHLPRLIEVGQGFVLNGDETSHMITVASIAVQ